jgi:hypothetical protein
VEHEVGAVLERPEDDRTKERVVGDEQEVVSAGKGRQGIEVRDAQRRVGRALDEQRARRGRDAASTASRSVGSTRVTPIPRRGKSSSSRTFVIANNS